MKAPDFTYARPASLAETFLPLNGGERVGRLAGGQSLLASLNPRLSAPSLLSISITFPNCADENSDPGKP